MFSGAGDSMGVRGKKARSWLLFFGLKLAKDTKARYVVLENVHAITSLNMRQLFTKVVSEVHLSGFKVMKWTTVKGYNVGSPQSIDIITSLLFFLCVLMLSVAGLACEFGARMLVYMNPVI